MKKTKDNFSSYASKVVNQNSAHDVPSTQRSNSKKMQLPRRGTEQESPVNNVKGNRSPESLEKLMQQEDGEMSVTVDEFSNLQANHNVPFVPQPFYDESVPPPPLGMIASPRPGPLPMPAGVYSHIPPPVIYSQGSPPLPLSGPLQLVYLQHTPTGVNIIPFQAVGFPSFSPCSPRGFPAHPHHPVVVQTQQESRPELATATSQQYLSSHDEGMAINQQQQCVYTPAPYQNYQQPFPGMQFPHPTHPGLAGIPYGQQHPLGHIEQNDQPPKMFRPWEDHDEGQLKNSSKRSFTEEDFPALEEGLSKMNLK